MSDRDDSLYTVTSVSLPIWQVKWMRNNISNRSEFIRALIEEHINFATGFEGILSRLESDKNELLEQLDGVNQRIQTIRMSSVKIAEETEDERERRLQQLKKEFEI